MKVNFAQAKNSRLPFAVGACATDERFRALLNEGMERLIYQGHWHGTTARFRMCAVDGCITFPPQIATLETVAISGRPVTLRTQWYEWAEGGMGIQSSGSCGTTDGSCGAGCGMNDAIFRGRFPSFSEPTGLNKKLNVVCDLASDVGRHILVCGYDENGNWIRTEQDGVKADGELITLAQSPGTTSTSFFSSISDVQLNDERDGQVWLWEKNNDTGILRLIGQYQSFETNPDYARYFFPSIQTSAASNGACSQTLVDGIAKLNWWPVKADTDLLCIPCLPALKELLQALNESENEPDGLRKKQIIAAGMAGAVEILQKQLQHFVSDGAVATLNIVGSGIGSIDPVANLL